MRFLFGLIVGAAAVLLLAEGIAGDVDWRTRFDAAVVHVERWVERARGAAAGRPVAAPRPMPEPAVPATDGSPPDALAAAPAPKAADDAPPERDPGADAAGAPDPSPGTHRVLASGAADADPSKLRLAGASEPAEPPAGQVEPAAEPIPRPPDPDPVAPAEPEQQGHPAAAGGAVAAATKSQAVWTPFHSEMSANGFAARLRRSLDHPFQVVREGPGQYQVVFPYRTEPQRRQLLAEAAEATGLPL